MTINSNVLFASQNATDTATITGGATATGFPLTSLQSMDMWTFARFSALTAANTYFVLEWTTPQPFQLVALFKHNLTRFARWRVRIADSMLDVTLAPVYDSGWIRAFPSFTQYGVLPWGQWNWGEILTDKFYSAVNRNSWHPMTEEVSGKFLRIDIDDEFESTDGYVQLARLMCSPIYQPSINAQYGAQIIPIDKTKVQESDSGVRFYGTRNVRRSMEFQIELPQDELLYYVYGPLYMGNGMPGELAVMLQPTTPQSWFSDALYGNLDKVEPIEHVSWLQMGTSMTIDERV